jgi:hypothetical protein
MFGVCPITKCPARAAFVGRRLTPELVEPETTFGEISAGEFQDFIGENMRLDPINIHHLYSSDELFSFFMGKNTQERKEFIIENLRVEKDLIGKPAPRPEWHVDKPCIRRIPSEKRDLHPVANPAAEPGGNESQQRQSSIRSALRW